MTSATRGDFRPLHRDIDLVRPVEAFQFSALARRLHGFDRWIDINSESDEDGAEGENVNAEDLHGAF